MTNRFNNLNEAFIAKGYAPDWRPDVSSYPEEERDQKIAQFELETLISATNGEGKIDWTNRNQRKWFPIVEVVKDADKPSGLGLSLTTTLYDGSTTACGSRLLHLDRDDLIYNFNQFREVFERAYLG